MRFSWLVPLIVAGSASTAAHAAAQTCAPPAGFVGTPRPAIASPDHLVAHTETDIVDRPLSVVMDVNGKTSLKNAIQKADTLPGVAGEFPLNKVPPGTPGFLHLVCLTDGSTLEEYTLLKERVGDTYTFRYLVWNYTSDQARPIAYAVGEIQDTQIDARHTRVVWTYAFKLKDRAFPGYLGPFGKYLFHKGFLDGKYAQMMRATLAAGKAAAEREPA